MTAGYTHTQVGRGLLVTLGTIFGMILGSFAWFVAPAPWFVYAVLAAAALLCFVVLYVFSRLTIAVDDAAVRWQFGSGQASRGDCPGSPSSGHEPRSCLAD